MAVVSAFERLAGRYSALQRASVDIQGQVVRDKLSRVMAATRHTPFYRRLYADAGVAPESIQTAEDLWRVPAITKQDLVALGAEPYFDERIDPARLSTTSTSGSLGKPLTLYNTSSDAAQLLAVLHSPWVEYGVNRDDRVLMLLAPYLEWAPPGWQTRFVAAAGGHRGVVEAFRDFAPTAVVGSTEAMALLADEVARDIGLREIAAQVRVLFPFGQTLSQQMREMLRRGFAAPIHDVYGSQEALWLGVECGGNRGHHVPVGTVIVQLAQLGRPDVPAAPGELGEVVLTSLVRTTSPMVRYRVQDVARFDAAPCSCGRITPRLTSLEGRVQDFFVSTRGELVAPGNVCVEVSRHDKVLDHRVVQESLQQVRVQIVARGEFTADDDTTLRRVVASHLGDMAVQIQLVQEIERDPSGKRRRAHRAFPLPVHLL